MAVDIETLVGKENMEYAARAIVLDLIRKIPESAVTKRYLFGRWMRLVGRHPSAADVDAVAPWNQG